MDEIQPRRLVKSQSVRQRITPTFLHHNIFGQQNTDDPIHTRYTPTFSSTVFDCSGYHVETKHSRSLRHPPQERTHYDETSTYNNISKQRKIAELNPCVKFTIGQNIQPQSDPKDRAKHQIYHNSGATSRMKKVADLMSNPIFGLGFVWMPQKTCVPSNGQNGVYDSNKYKKTADLEKVEKQPQKDKNESVVNGQSTRNDKISNKKDDLGKNQKIQQKKTDKKSKKQVKNQKVQIQKSLKRFKSDQNIKAKNQIK